MPTKSSVKPGWSTKTKIALGVGGLLAVAAGVYLLTGKRGEKNRIRIKKWALAMKKEVVSRMQGLETVNRDGYERIVAQVAKRYRSMKDVEPGELGRVTREINRQWASIEKKAHLLKASGNGKKRLVAV